MGHGGRFRQDAGMQGSLLSCVFHFSSDCLSSHIAQGDLEFPVSCFSPKSSGFTSVPHLVPRVFLISSRLW